MKLNSNQQGIILNFVTSRRDIKPSIFISLVQRDNDAREKPRLMRFYSERPSTFSGFLLNLNAYVFEVFERSLKCTKNL